MLLVAGVARLLVRGRAGAARRAVLAWMRPWAIAVVVYVVLVAPWRIWTAVHRLSDSVQPPLAKALDPVYVVGRHHELSQSVTWMAKEIVVRWPWLIGIFVALCLVAVLVAPGER